MTQTQTVVVPRILVATRMAKRVTKTKLKADKIHLDLRESVPALESGLWFVKPLTGPHRRPPR